MDTQALMQQNLLVRMLAGSHAYGTNLPSSDVDYRGLFFAPPECIRTPFFNLTEVSDTSEEDTKYYEISQFMKLYTLANPNILELLFTDRSKIELTSDPYELLRANASKLLSKKVAFTFSGYALAQLKRIKGHNKWINNPQPVNPPRQIDYVSLIQNFTQEQVFKLNIEDLKNDWVMLPYGSDLYGLYQFDDPEYQAIMQVKKHSIYNANFTLNPYKVEENDKIFGQDGIRRKSPKYLVKYNKEQYKQDHEVWKNYWNWKKNRNEARGTLEEQFGYDTKHAMHLVRLLNMGEEILTDGTVNVLRPDVELLLDIRAGKWSYDELVKFAEEKDVLIRTQLYNTSPLPKMPDLHYAAKLLMEAQDMCWSGQVNLRKVGE